RARASRMHDFASLESLGAVLQSLQASQLVQALSPPGRGQTFAHALYPADEQQYLAEKVAPVTGATEDARAALQATATAAPPATGASATREAANADVIAQLQQQLQRLEAEVEELRH